jgi:hypothetical protein
VHLGELHSKKKPHRLYRSRRFLLVLMRRASEGMRQQVDRESNEPYSDEQLSLIEAVGFAFDARHAQVCSSGYCQRTQGIQWCEGCPAPHYYCPDCASGELACIRRCCYKCLQ